MKFFLKYSDKSQELGQIRYVFSDKTGTLTQNIMEFQCASIDGKMYDILNAKSVQEAIQMVFMTFHFYGPTIYSYLESIIFITQSKNGHEEKIREFFIHLCICHTVIPEINQVTNEITYNASSPDEEALVKGATLFGFR